MIDVNVIYLRLLREQVEFWVRTKAATLYAYTKRRSSYGRRRRCGLYPRLPFFFIDALEHLGQGGFIHGENPFRANSLQEAGDGWIVEYEPIIFGCDVDIAEADLLGRKLELGSAVGSLTLLDQALLVQQQETPANHHCALCELFCDCCRGVHGARF